MYPHLLTEGSKPVKQEAVKGGQMVYLPFHSIYSSFFIQHPVQSRLIKEMKRTVTYRSVKEKTEDIVSVYFGSLGHSSIVAKVIYPVLPFKAFLSVTAGGKN